LGRGEHVVFKCDDEDVWCIAWSDVHFKLYLATCGESRPGESAAKKRQRSDGRNFSIQVDRPKAVAECATNMGNVDLHNRCRQGTLRLHQAWKTATWQVRVQNELFGACLVDAFLTAQRLMPKWKGAREESKFFEWVGALLGQLEDMAKENDYVLCAENDAVVEAVTYEQVKIGTTTIKDGVHAGKKRTMQGRCRCCSLNKRFEKRGRGANAKNGATRCIYTCSQHPGEHTCKIGKCTCWAEHLAAHKEIDSPSR
jgi:hypothetical protein